jgi:hypothetical protein
MASDRRICTSPTCVVARIGSRTQATVVWWHASADAHKPHLCNDTDGLGSAYLHKPHLCNDTAGLGSAYVHKPHLCNDTDGLGDAYRHKPHL